MSGGIIVISPDFSV